MDESRAKTDGGEKSEIEADVRFEKEARDEIVSDGGGAGSSPNEIGSLHI